MVGVSLDYQLLSTLRANNPTCKSPSSRRVPVLVGGYAASVSRSTMATGTGATCCSRQAHEPSGPTPSPFWSWYVVLPNKWSGGYPSLPSDIPAGLAVRSPLHAACLSRRAQQVPSPSSYARTASAAVQPPLGAHAPPRPPRPPIRHLRAIRPRQYAPAPSKRR